MSDMYGIAEQLSESILDGGVAPGDPRLPASLDMMSSIPGIPTLGAYAAYRGRNTILRGGVREGGRFRGYRGPKGGAVRQGWANNNPFNPRVWSRYATSDFFHQTGATGGRKGQYSTHNIARGTNALMRFATGTAETFNPFGGEGRAGGRIASALNSREMMPGEGEDFVSRGFLARAGAGAKVAGMSSRQLAKRAPNTMGFLQGAGWSEDAARRLSTNPRGAGQALMMSGSGTITGRLGGYTARTMGRAGGTINDVLDGATSHARTGYANAQRDIRTLHEAARPGRAKIAYADRLRARDVARGGYQAIRGQQAAKAGGKAILGTLGTSAKLGGAVAFRGATRLMGPVGAVLLAKDAGELTTKGMGYGARAWGNFVNSYQGGPMNEVLGGSGFMDNETTATSRARGVAAIQNSRLNARSVLGSEAGQMAGYYG